MEHAYSATPRSLGARVAPGLLLKLEELMLEGDLLEVRLEEQAQLWAAVVAARGAEGRRCTRVLDAGRRKRAQRTPRPHRQLKRTRPLLGRPPPPAPPAPPASSRGRARSDPRSVAGAAPKTSVKRGSATTTNYLNRKQVRFHSSCAGLTSTSYDS